MKGKIALPSQVSYVLHKLDQYGYAAYVVGGCVRDSILGRKPMDWDVTSSAKPKEVLQIFVEDKVIETGIQHGTVTVLKDGIPIEITTFRKEGNYSDFRRPDAVEFVEDIRLDLARRDFTINALAYTPEEGVLDLFGGLSDLQAGILRTVGDPERRFAEDALRMMRCLRFAAVYNFSIEEKTALALLENRKLLSHIASERIYEEWKRLLDAPKPSSVFYRFFPVLTEIFPGAQLGKIDLLDVLPRDLVLRMCCFFYVIFDVVHRMEYAKSACTSLKMDRKTKTAILQLLSLLSNDVPVDEYSIKKMLHQIGAEQFDRFLRIQRIDEKNREKSIRAQRIYHRIISEKKCFSLPDLQIHGGDLIDEDIGGKNIGRCLELLLDAVMREEVENQKDHLRAFLQMKKKDWLSS